MTRGLSGFGEFSIIEELFAPLARDVDGAFDLRDDAALLAESAYIVTKDVLISGVHFRPDDPLDGVAQKLLRVNLSDLAAKGARPSGYLLGCAWPKGVRKRDMAQFAEGLARDQETFRLSLYGGDTTVHRRADAPLVISATLFGKPPRNGPTLRNGAHAGDDIYVTGSIGDAGLGLRSLEGAETFKGDHREHLVTRYLKPEPRVSIGGALAGLATAAVDVSDGLIADCLHILEASDRDLKAVLRAEVLPISDAAAGWVARQDDQDAAFAALATFGDDYEILFTAPPSRRRSVEMAASVARTPVARIGTMARGENSLEFLNRDGALIPVASTGFDHFA